MAIERIEDTEKGLDIIITNGDRRALAKIKEEWKFKNEESALRFAIAVLVQSTRDSLGFKNEEGNISLFKPGDELLEK